MDFPDPDFENSTYPGTSKQDRVSVRETHVTLIQTPIVHQVTTSTIREIIHESVIDVRIYTFPYDLMIPGIEQ